MSLSFRDSQGGWCLAVSFRFRRLPGVPTPPECCLYNAPMPNRTFLAILWLHLGLPGLSHAVDEVDAVKKAIERSTLNQPGTKPFHLKAVLAPSFERDRNSGRTGKVEIW